jgi:diguanylate cyclase (GGDEF)-like protein/PAS domain S-box-containing protein
MSNRALTSNKSIVHLNSCITSLDNQEKKLSCLVPEQLSSNEVARLAFLHHYQILDTEPEKVFDDLTCLAAHICETPFALISLSDTSRQWFKSKVGLNTTEVPRDVAFCAHALLQPNVFIIPDTLADERFATNPLVISDPYIRFYAGVPLITSVGHALGTLCVLDRVPKQLQPQQVEALQALSREVIAQLELRCNLIDLVSVNTKLQLAQEALRESENKYRSVVGNVKEVIFQTDATGNWIFLNPAWTEITSFSIRESIGTNFLQYVHDRDRQRAQELFESLISRQEEFCCHEVRYLTKYGGYRWIEVSARLTLDPNEQIIGISGTLNDITKRKQTEERLRLLESVVVSANDAVIITTAEPIDELGLQIIYTNQAFTNMTGYSHEEVQGKTPRLLQGPKTDRATLDKIRAALEAWQPVVVELINYRKDGSEFWVELSIVPVADETGWYTNWISVQRNITERKQVEAALLRVAVTEATNQKLKKEIGKRKRVEAQLLHNSLHDILTRLPNRALFMDRLERALMQTKKRPDCLTAVLFLDLDRFKLVNDSLGHLSGDELLRQIAFRVKGCLREEDTISRFGGDEFIILLENIQDISEATQIAKRLQEGLALPFILNKHEVFTAVSIGIALSSNGCEQPEELLRNADIAMYRAKNLGRARYSVFDTAMHDQAVELLQLETDLRRAVERQEFHLHYQPVFSLSTGKISGFEALVRWQHPERGLISPAEFIPLMEETGLIVPLGAWILHSACHQMRVWQQQFPTSEPMTISVNISGRQFFQSELVEQIAQVLQETGLDARSLKLEITENVIMGNTHSATSMLQRLKALGIQLHMDDFGTGYSSLSYLRRFPIDTLKIDRSFVSQMEIDDENLALVQTIVTLAHNLGMSVTAEGIETASQLALLQTMKCEFGQGYLFSKPVEASAAGLLIANSKIALESVE